MQFELGGHAASAAHPNGDKDADGGLIIPFCTEV